LPVRAARQPRNAAGAQRLAQGAGEEAPNGICQAAGRKTRTRAERRPDGAERISRAFESTGPFRMRWLLLCVPPFLCGEKNAPRERHSPGSPGRLPSRPPPAERRHQMLTQRLDVPHLEPLDEQHR